MMTGMEKILDQELSLNQPHYSVLNCSWYLPASLDSSGMLSQMFRKAISLGIYVIAAAGNNGVCGIFPLRLMKADSVIPQDFNR